ncbi:hypothetical protein VTI74DRAFT_2110 [Chaetomium olivicolor]
MRILPSLLVLPSLAEAISVSQRRKVVQSLNVRRTKSSDSTPLQVGNGNFAFGADITGLQTFKPYAIMSTWGWHNFSLPTTPGQTSVNVRIEHTLDETTYYTHIAWTGRGTITGPAPDTHRYTFTTAQPTLHPVITYSPTPNIRSPAFSHVVSSSRTWWRAFWTTSVFVDLTHVPSARAQSLQRRIILSQYLTTVNSASSLPQQESGLVNNGWHGKFHLEMALWHTLPFARWGQFPLFRRSQPSTYHSFLPSAKERAKRQGYSGPRWGKMSDPAGRSAPGDINALLLWQQPHVMYCAETEWRAFPEERTLARWEDVVQETAEFMASRAWWNESSGRWKERMGKEAPSEWVRVRDGLAPLPMVNGTYAVYEGIEGMWTSNATTNDHPAMAGIFGLLPPPASGPPLDMDALRKTAGKIKELWALDYSYGWDFAMLAMNSLRLGDPEQAVEYLLHPIFQFDDAGYPVGGSRVPTPYFPNSASFLIATAMMAGGWDGGEGVKGHWPND